MAKKKRFEKKSTKIKLKQTKKSEVLVAPRLRLEPRLTPSPSKKKKSCLDHAHESKKSSCSERSLEKDASEKNSFCEENSFVINDHKEQKREVFDDRNLSTVIESRGYETPNSESLVPKNSQVEENHYFKEQSEQYKKKKSSKPALKGLDWNDREWMDLAISLQAHGFSDLKKIADCVKTKSENDIRQFIKLRRKDAIYNPGSKKWNRQGNSWNTLRSEFLATWPNIRKWRKIAYEQMLLYTRSKDYSKPVISALCKKFYEEEKEPADPQVINVKLIYKYVMSCMSGSIPPQLPPKESALVLDLLREVRLMPLAYDFEEERKFLQDFRSATKFKPFQVKDEFRKRYNKVSDDMFSPNTVAVPEEVFLDLSRHKRLTQSFSPLVTPVWMLQKEQEVLEKYTKESNVYVDGQ